MFQSITPVVARSTCPSGRIDRRLYQTMILPPRFGTGRRHGSHGKKQHIRKRSAQA